MREEKANSLKGYRGFSLPVTLFIAGLVIFVVVTGLATTAAARAANAFATDTVPILDLDGSAPGINYDEATFTEDAGVVPIVSTTDLTITADGPNLSSASILLVARPNGSQEILDATNIPGTIIQKSFNFDAGLLTLTGIDTISNYETALKSVTYANSSQAPDAATREVSFIINDGDLGSSPASSFVEIISVNDAPLLDNSGNMHLDSIRENDVSPTGNDVADIISSAETAGEDRITDPDLFDPEGIAVIAVGDTNGTWQFSTDSGSTWTNFGAVTDVEAVLLDLSAFVRFVPNINYSGQANFNFRAWDQTTLETSGSRVDASNNGGITAFSTSSGTVTIDVLAASANYPAVVTIAEDTTAVFTEGKGPVVVAGPALQIVDVDNDYLLSATVSIKGLALSEPDILSATTNGTGIIANYAAETGTLSLSGNAAVADYQAVLRSVTFDNLSRDPLVDVRNIGFVVNDGIDPSNEAIGIVRVESINDPPLLDINVAAPGADSIVHFSKDGTGIGGAVGLATRLQVQDADDTSLIGARVYLQNRPDGLLESLSADTAGTNIIATPSEDNAAIEFSGQDSLMAYEQVLRTVKYINSSPRAHRAEREVLFSVEDGSSLSATQIAWVIVIPQYVHFPVVIHQANGQELNEEPNDECEEAVSIAVNTDYHFGADDAQDWFSFTTSQTASITVDLAEFAPKEGQLAVGRGDCGSLTGVGVNDGDPETNKRVGPITLEAGRYYVLVTNDGPTNLKDLYRLRVRVE